MNPLHALQAQNPGPPFTHPSVVLSLFIDHCHRSLTITNWRSAPSIPLDNPTPQMYTLTGIVRQTTGIQSNEVGLEKQMKPDLPPPLRTLAWMGVAVGAFAILAAGLLLMLHWRNSDLAEPFRPAWILAACLVSALICCSIHRLLYGSPWGRNSVLIAVRHAPDYLAGSRPCSASRPGLFSTAGLAYRAYCLFTRSLFFLFLFVFTILAFIIF